MRLSKTWKQDAIFEIVKNKCKDEEEAIDQKMSDFALSYINKLNKPYIKQLESLPEKYIHHAKCVYIKYGDSYYERMDVVIPKTIVPADIQSNMIQLKGKEKQEFLKLKAEIDDLKTFKSDLRRELTSVIMGCTTSNILLKAFPEIENYITLPNKTYPVAVQTSKLKNMLEKEL